MGYDNDSTIYDIILGFILKITQSEIFYYVKFLSDVIHEQFVQFQSLKCFRYQSYLIYFMIYYQSTHFEHLGLNRVDQRGNIFLVLD
jgi:hypothetical protein